jgi:hypothetical protein
MKEHIPTFRLRAEYDGLLVARDGVIISFFMRRSHGELAPAIWQALQTYMRAIPPQSLAWTFDHEGEPIPLDDEGWQSIRTRILERPWPASTYAQLRALPSGAGDYSFEYVGCWLDSPLHVNKEGATCALSLSLPTEYLLEHGPAHVRSLALELARELPFSFGYASLAFVSPNGIWNVAPDEFYDLAVRYPGMDVYFLRETCRYIGIRARGAYWLTFLGQPLLGQLGGIEALREKLRFPEVSLLPMEGERLLLTLGQWPDPIDLHLPVHLPHLRALALLLEPFLLDELIGLSPSQRQQRRYWYLHLRR